MIHLKEGSKAPLFEGIDQTGKEIKISDFKGKRIVLFFYPKDDTEACTKEACNLRDNYELLLKQGFEVIGVSPDEEKSHKSFSRKFSLPFPLIADPSKKIITKYGVWGEKSLYGRNFMGVLRTTFIINEKGLIDKIIPNVNTARHTEQIFKMYI
jgi:peroxiredoxin Q/BCP